MQIERGAHESGASYSTGSLVWRVLVFGLAMAVLVGVVWYLGIAGMRAGAVRAFVVLGAMGAALAWLLLRRSSRFPLILAAVMVACACLAASLAAVAPIMHDRLLASYPAEAVPVGAQHRETRKFGDTIGISGAPSVIRWYEVAGSDPMLERQIRDALQRQGWRVRRPRTGLFDFVAVDPTGQLEAAVAVGVESPSQRFESGSDEPLPRSEGSTIVEVSIGLHHGT